MNAQVGPDAAPATSAPTSATSTCTRRSASPTAAAAPAWARSASPRTSRRSCPGHPVTGLGGRARRRARSRPRPGAAPSILPISWAYIAMMGADGLKRATEVAILNANYMAKRLEAHYPVLYTGKNGRVAHEFILDTRRSRSRRRRGRRHRQAPHGLRLPRPDDVLPGAGHADDRAHRERVEGGARPLLRRDDRDPRGDPRDRGGKIPADRSPLRHAPHTAHAVTASAWDRPYSREQAAFPAPWVKDGKFWPAVGPHRQHVRRPEPGLHLPADGRLRPDQDEPWDRETAQDRPWDGQTAQDKRTPTPSGGSS